MTPGKLRGITRRLGAAGTLFVGVYLLLRHLWHRRRPHLIATGAVTLAGMTWLALRHPAEPDGRW